MPFHFSFLPFPRRSPSGVFIICGGFREICLPFGPVFAGNIAEQAQNCFKIIKQCGKRLLSLKKTLAIQISLCYNIQAVNEGCTADFRATE
jgi:hypothetical protein